MLVAHRATGSLGYAFVESRRHAPYMDDLTDAEAEVVGRVTTRLARGLRSELNIASVHSFVAGIGVAHFHQHVFVRHIGSPEQYAWWQQWPDAPQGDIKALANRLGGYIDPR